MSPDRGRPTKQRPLRTAEVARAVGVHPNTVRLYEEWGFLPPIPRGPNGYRLFTTEHVDQMRLARTALQWPYPGGKDPVLALVFRAEAEAAAEFLDQWARGVPADATAEPLRIGQVAERLGVTIDTLRSWERNGLIAVPRDPRSGYRRYSAAEIGRLRVIRLLRQAGYSCMAILRIFLRLQHGLDDVRHALDTPSPDEDVYTAADRWQSALRDQERRAQDVIAQPRAMIERRRPAR